MQTRLGVSPSLKAHTASIKLITQVLMLKSQLWDRQSADLLQRVTQLYAYSPDRHVTKTIPSKSQLVECYTTVRSLQIYVEVFQGGSICLQPDVDFFFFFFFLVFLM
jgi:hypothetical protein